MEIFSSYFISWIYSTNEIISYNARSIWFLTRNACLRRRNRFTIVSNWLKQTITGPQFFLRHRCRLENGIKSFRQLCTWWPSHPALHSTFCTGPSILAPSWSFTGHQCATWSARLLVYFQQRRNALGVRLAIKRSRDSTSGRRTRKLHYFNWKQQATPTSWKTGSMPYSPQLAVADHGQIGMRE